MFDRLFRTDAPFWELMGRVGDLIIINILTVVLSIPVVTIGASLTALTDVTHKLAQDVGGSVVRLYLPQAPQLYGCYPSSRSCLS